MNRNLFNLFRILEVLWPCPANSVSAENRIGSKSYDGQQPGVLGIKKKKKNQSQDQAWSVSVPAPRQKGNTQGSENMCCGDAKGDL